MNTIDHEALAVSRLATQYRESVNLIAYIKALLSEADTLEEVFQNIIDERWIDTAEGVNLDIIGSIVGQGRALIDAAIFDYFGFAGEPTAQSFGDLDDPGVGGRFVSVGEPTTGIRYLTDDEYRAFIRSRIIRNSTKSTPEEIIAQLKFLLGDVSILLLEGSYASYTISIGRILTLNEKALLGEGLVPKTAGVAAVYLTEFDSESFFSFGGVVGGEGFGDLDDANIGGKLGSLI